MQRFRMRNVPLFLGHAGELETVFADGLDIVVPEVDQRHVVTVQRQMPADITADGAAAHHHDTLSHYFLRILLATSFMSRDALMPAPTVYRVGEKCLWLVQAPTNP